MSKQINFNLDFKEFKETDNSGEFEGILVNYEHKKLGHGYYKFGKGSMKQNEGKTMFLMYNHNGSVIPVGTMTGIDTPKGFKINAKFQLTKDDNGNAVNRDAVALYDLMKNGAEFELSAGGFIEKGGSKNEIIDEKETYFYLIEEFNAHEGSLTPRGAIEGSKVTKVFSDLINENIEFNKNNGGIDKMEKKEMQEMLAEFAKNLNQDKMTEEFKKDFAALKETLEKSELKFATKEEVKEVMDTLKKFDDVINKLSGPNQNSEVKLSDDEMYEIFGKAAAQLFKEEKGVTLTNVVNSENFAMTTTSNAKAIKSAYVNKIMEVVQDTNPFMQDITFLEISDSKLTIPKEMIGLPETGWIGESEERVETYGITITDVTIDLYTIYAMPVITNRLLATNYVQLGKFLLMRLAQAFDKAISDALLFGRGATHPVGIFEDTTVKAELVGVSTITGDNLIDLVTKVAETYSNKGKFYMNRLTWGEIIKLKDSNDNYYMGSLIDRAGKTIQGRPVVLVDSIKPVTTATKGEPIVLFGNANMGMFGIKNSGLDLQIEDKITSKGFTKYYSEMGLGAAVVLPEAFSGLKKS